MDKSRPQPRYLFLAETLEDTVTDSAVINWLQLFQREGMVFDVIITPRLGLFLRTRPQTQKKIDYFKKKISGKFYTIPFVCGIKQPLILLGLLCLLFRDIKQGRQIIIQTRIAHLTATRLLRAIYRNVYIVYDVRGAGPEEFLLNVQAGHIKPGLRKTLFQFRACKQFVYKNKLALMIDFACMADSVLCVSHKLKQYLLAKCPALHNKNINVIPGSAEQAMFYWSEEARARIRKELNITDKFVFVYAGALAMAWQMPSFIFEMFALLAARNPQVFLMCLTPHTRIVHDYMRQLGLRDDQVWTHYINYTDVSQYLSAADAGILFRENSPTNNVASPTKFAEYLLAGLPVVISEGIGDFGEFVTQNQVGVVVQNNSDTLITDIEKNIVAASFDRNRICTLARNHFTKEKNLEFFLDIYKNKAVQAGQIIARASLHR